MGRNKSTGSYIANDGLVLALESSDGRGIVTELQDIV